MFSNRSKEGSRRLQAGLLCIACISCIAFGQVAVSVDWNTVKRTVDPLAYGVGASNGYRPTSTSNAGYRTGLKYACGKASGGTGLVRIHTQGAMQSWSPGGTWDATIINNALKPLVDDGFDIEINIDRNIGGNGYCITSQAAADLVRVINVTLGLHVKYWEVNNEGSCSSGGDLKNVSRAMKAVDPTITVGGPGWFNMDVNWLTTYVRDALPDIDFVGFHEYANGGNFGQPDNVSYDAAARVGAQIKTLRANIDQMSPNKHVAIQWNEYNFDWSYTNGTDPRVRNNKGGVLDALIMISTVDNGGDASNIWNECQGVFGFMTSSGSLYTPAHVFHLFNQHMYGQQVAATTSNSGAIVAYAVKSASKYAIALVNRSATQQTVNVTCAGWTAPGTLKRYQVWTTNGIDSTTQNWTTGGNSLTLPDNSVTILTSGNSTGSSPDLAVCAAPRGVSIFANAGAVRIVIDRPGNHDIDILDARGTVRTRIQGAKPNAYMLPFSAAGHGMRLVRIRCDNTSFGKEVIIP